MFAVGVPCKTRTIQRGLDNSYVLPLRDWLSINLYVTPPDYSTWIVEKNFIYLQHMDTTKNYKI